MPFPIVSLVLPADMPAPVAAATVEGCNSAYGGAGCSTNPPGNSNESLVAQIRWLSRDDLEFALRLAGWPLERALRRQLHFENNDADTDRARSAGLAVGSLATTLIEFMQLENAPDAPRETATTSPTEPDPSELQESEKLRLLSEKEKPTAVVRPASTGQPRPEPSPEPRPNVASAENAPLAPRIGGAVSALGGSGFSSLRWGVLGRIEASLRQRWVIGANFDYAIEPATRQQVQPTFLRVTADFGVRFPVGPLSLQATLGALRERDTLSATATNAHVARWRWGSEARFSAFLTQSTLSPWLWVSGSLVPALDVPVKGRSSTLTTLTLDSFNAFFGLGIHLDVEL